MIFTTTLYTTKKIKTFSINFIASELWNTLLDWSILRVSSAELPTKVRVAPGYHSIVVQLVIRVVSEIQYFDSSCPVIGSRRPHDDQLLQQEKQKDVGERNKEQSQPNKNSCFTQ